MLLTQREWNKLISGITKTCDKRLIKPLQTKHQRVERHFATDYSGSQGVTELASQPTHLWVSVDIWQDLDKLDGCDGEILIGELIDVTPLVELENGETLSDQEAIDGLGSFLPELAEPIKKRCVMDGQIEFQVPELELQTLLELRARAVHLRERAEFHIEAGNPLLGEVLFGLAERTPPEVKVIVKFMIERWSGVKDLTGIPSELYQQETTLEESIEVWSLIFGRGSDDPFVDIEDLETEINICLEPKGEQ